MYQTILVMIFISYPNNRWRFIKSLKSSFLVLSSEKIKQIKQTKSKQIFEESKQRAD